MDPDIDKQNRQKLWATVGCLCLKGWRVDCVPPQFTQNAYPMLI